MGLSRKHKKDLKRLRKNVEAVWSEQQEVLSHAASVLEKSRRHAAKYAKKEVVPLVKDTYNSRVKPVYDNGLSAVEGTYSSARDAYKHRVLPTFAAVGGTAAAAFEAAKDSKNRAKLGEISKARWQELTTPPKKKNRVGTVFAIGAALVAVGGIGYAVWQTFRADDELWVAEDEPQSAAQDAASTAS
ncbi:hypothetical protein C5C31_12400 [Rathayibacter rathayi]|uniref:DNA helicase n=1 Tax=Rathayibacter rathayi TaxID=33887 RepID=A0ABD6W5S6_RATRA|nr:hypothetical protein [Rathayibacter rathayi]AZZ50072.1 hypothetical protein C1O28_13460 [Rathayibacter rathayi]MWV75674.1 hypothetical protein [Rathayibacter rathayi NCPPB 2980 = VKM Ac-1601]PPF10655.1 hypothetical protein C5C04_13110 [Rathayibacter rathayi]PPF23259.1 hypothetical protein C5C34_09440 [Rathayibacter rathayi]PPF43506.1 hypothetical protein C5C08_14070 [Rathayibacter rathayi]